jgi:hypothetical protein
MTVLGRQIRLSASTRQQGLEEILPSRVGNYPNFRSPKVLALHVAGASWSAPWQMPCSPCLLRHQCRSKRFRLRQCTSFHRAVLRPILKLTIAVTLLLNGCRHGLFFLRVAPPTPPRVVHKTHCNRHQGLHRHK